MLFFTYMAHMLTIKNSQGFSQQALALRAFLLWHFISKTQIKSGYEKSTSERKMYDSIRWNDEESL